MNNLNLKHNIATLSEAIIIHDNELCVMFTSDLANNIVKNCNCAFRNDYIEANKHVLILEHIAFNHGYSMCCVVRVMLDDGRIRILSLLKSELCFADIASA